MTEAQAHQALESYYAALPREDRYFTRCVMHLPEDLTSKRVLDLECRRGKGAFGISDRVGPEGFVIGLDSSESLIAEAIEQAPKNHRAKEKWGHHLSFDQGYFEDLRSAGIKDASIDIVIVNSVLNLAYDRELTLREIHRVLAPEGYLYYSGIFADKPIPKEVIDELRIEGNVFATASTLEAFESLIKHVGFSVSRFSQGRAVHPTGADESVLLHNFSFTERIAQVLL